MRTLLLFISGVVISASFIACSPQERLHVYNATDSAIEVSFGTPDEAISTPQRIEPHQDRYVLTQIEPGKKLGLRIHSAAGFRYYAIYDYTTPSRPRGAAFPTAFVHRAASVFSIQTVFDSDQRLFLVPPGAQPQSYRSLQQPRGFPLSPTSKA